MVTQHREGRGMVALKLLSLAESMPRVPSVPCENCQEKICLVGREVPQHKLFHGQHVKANTNNDGYWIKDQTLRFSVNHVGKNDVTLILKGKESGRGGYLTHDKRSGFGPYAINYYQLGYGRTISTLVYDCHNTLNLRKYRVSRLRVT